MLLLALALDSHVLLFPMLGPHFTTKFNINPQIFNKFLFFFQLEFSTAQIIMTINTT